MIPLKPYGIRGLERFYTNRGLALKVVLAQKQAISKHISRWWIVGYSGSLIKYSTIGHLQTNLALFQNLLSYRIKSLVESDLQTAKIADYRQKLLVENGL